MSNFRKNIYKIRKTTRNVIQATEEVHKPRFRPNSSKILQIGSIYDVNSNSILFNFPQMAKTEIHMPRIINITDDDVKFVVFSINGTVIDAIPGYLLAPLRLLYNIYDDTVLPFYLLTKSTVPYLSKSNVKIEIILADNFQRTNVPNVELYINQIINTELKERIKMPLKEHFYSLTENCIGANLSEKNFKFLGTIYGILMYQCQYNAVEPDFFLKFDNNTHTIPIENNYYLFGNSNIIYIMLDGGINFSNVEESHFETRNNNIFSDVSFQKIYGIRSNVISYSNGVAQITFK